MRLITLLYHSILNILKVTEKDLLSDKTTPDVVGQRGINNWQMSSDITSFQVILETGTWNGGRAIEMALAAFFDNVDKVYYKGYDLFEDADEFTDRTELNTKPHNLYKAVEKRLNDLKKYVKEKMNKEFDFDLVKGDTKKTLTEQKDFDIAYLDGGHSFETVKHDYNMCKQLTLLCLMITLQKMKEVKKLLTNIKEQIKSLINLIKNIDEKFSL